MDSWERYIHTPAPDVLIQLAVLHAEFEAIHPFLDGNGRLGRLIIPLFLKSKNLLSAPNFYLSEQYGVRALDWFFSHPIFVTSHFMRWVDIPESSARRILRLVRDEGLLREMRPSRGQRPAVLTFPELLNICEGKVVF